MLMMQYSDKLETVKYFYDRCKTKAYSKDDVMLRMIEDAFIAGMNRQELGHQEALGSWLNTILACKYKRDYMNDHARKARRANKWEI